MDQFEDTVVNPNISLNNFEVKIREHENSSTNRNTSADIVEKQKNKSTSKGLYLLALLTAIFIYQITIGI